MVPVSGIKLRKVESNQQFSPVVSVNQDNDQHGNITLWMQQWHRGNQRLSNWFKTHKKEIVPGTGNVNNYLKLVVKPGILEENLQLPLF